MTGWFYTLPPYHFLTGRNGLGFDTEAAALAAARAAAGFGHVAERACGNHLGCPDVDMRGNADRECTHAAPGCACIRCAWSRDAHRVTP